MKKGIKCRIFFLAAQALIFAAQITYFKDCFSVSKLLYFILAFSLLPIVIILINPHSKFSKTVCGFAIAVVMIFGAVYGIYLRRPIGFVIAFSQAIAVFYFILSDRPKRKEHLWTKILVMVVLTATILNAGYLSNKLFRIENSTTLNASAAMWNESLAEFTDTFCENADTNEEKVQAIYTWVRDNIEYDWDKKPTIMQYFDVNDTMETKSGVCYDYACLFAAMCRSQNIPCLMVDGDPYVGKGAHTWNRVFYNGSWYQLDVTFDSTTKGNVLYGFRQVDTYSAPDDEYQITRIY